MTVSTTAFAVTLAGNGATTVFSFPFIADNASTIQVTYTDANGVQTVLSPGLYTLVINTPPVGGLWGIGGTVTYPLIGSAIASGTTLTIQRTVPYTQTVSIANQGAFYPSAVEQGLDLLELQIQQFQGQLANVVKAPVVDGVLDMTLPALAARANKFLLFNSSGQPTVSLGIPSTTPIGAGSIMFFLSAFASLALADAAASAVGGSLVIDSNVTLAGNTTLSTKEVIFAGGVITRGTFTLTINTIVAGNLAIFDKAGSGAITITKGPVNIAWFGASGDGVLDDFVPFQAALNASRVVFLDTKTYLYNGTLVIPANQTLIGGGAGTKISGNNVIKMDISVSGVHLSDFSFIGDGSEVITVGKNGQANNTIIERVNFVPTIANHLDRCVSLYNCTNTRVANCNFISTGYGVIHEASAFTVISLKVVDCYFSDMFGDAVLLNGAGGVARDVDIEGNSFQGSHDWTTPATERRFVGVTSIDSVKIINNYVTNCAGDSAVHLEDVGGRVTVLGNHFIDCGVSGGNDGYIYITNSTKSMIISNNWFARTTAPSGTAFISTQSTSTSGNLIIENNNFLDTSGHIIIACNLASHIGTTLVGNNFCQGCDKFVYLASADDIQIRGNTIVSVSTGIGGNVGSNIEVTGNKFQCSPDCILTATGSNWMVKENYFVGGSVTGTNMTDVWMAGNTFSSTVITRTMAAGAPTRVLEVNWNFKNGTGLV